jgi:hypothetical protein
MIFNPRCLAMKYSFRINKKPLTLKQVPLHSMRTAPNLPTTTILILENLDSFPNHLVSTATPHPTTLHSLPDTILPFLPDISHHPLHPFLLQRTLFPNHPLLHANILPARSVAKPATLLWTATIAWILHTKGAILPCNSMP